MTAPNPNRTTPKPAGPRCGYPATWGEVKLAATIIAACAAAAFALYAEFSRAAAAADNAPTSVYTTTTTEPKQ